MATDDRGGDCRDGGATMKRWLALFLLLPTLACAQTANLWIDTNGGTCTRQGTAATYVDAAACASIQAAIAACTAGDTIRMKAGTYGAQTITATKTSPGCTVIAESSTTVGKLETGGAWYELQNLNLVGNYWDSSGGVNITCRNCNINGNGTPTTWSYGQGPSAALSGTNISWIGGSIINFRCATCNSGLIVGGPSANIVVDGVLFNDVQGTGQAGGQHFEVIRIDGIINGLTIRNSTFTNNVASSSTVFFSNYDGSKPDNLLFENNFFGSVGPGYPDGASYHFNANFQNSSTCSNWTFRYNTFLTAVGQAPLSDAASMSCSGGSFTNVVWIGNLMPQGTCSGNTFQYNVGYGSGSACSGTGNSVKTQASIAFGGTSGFDLQAGSTAINAAAPVGSDCIARDHYGNSRPAGANCDAGAHEYGAGAGSAPSAPTNFRTTLRRMWYAMTRSN